MSATERRVAVIQPYFFPYFGYWQLMASADVFVVYDDVQYVRRSWMNRNRIVIDGEARWVTMPVTSMPLDTSIDRIELARHHGSAAAKICRQVRFGYRDAPNVHRALQLLEASFDSKDRLLTQTIYRSFDAIRGALGITTPMVRSSTLGVDRSLPKQQRLIEVCQAVGGTAHLSLSGGRTMYSVDDFASAGLGLLFHDLDHMRGATELSGAYSLLDTIATMPREWVQARLHDARWLDS